jgi:hypothetical protein
MSQNLIQQLLVHLDAVVELRIRGRPCNLLLRKADNIVWLDENGVAGEALSAAA